ncbi:MAG TPA: gamma-glutamyl-gamma-aminobutyrate hydrolase family protein [Caulobacteraceae bacterium]
MTRPVLGITCCNRPFGEETAQVVINRYVASAMRYADVAALLIPALPELMKPEEVASRLDGILLTGSPSNVEPWRYGEAGAENAGPFDPSRDAMVFGLVEAMKEAGRPVFGVCRGFEEVNVAFGGTLRRDAGSNPSLIDHHAPDGASLPELFAHEHEVALTPGGILARAFECEDLTVNSVHYQAIGRLGDGLTVEARSPDGLVEAVSAPGVLAVQWHPEWRAGDHPDSQTFFRLIGRALRGEPI